MQARSGSPCAASVFVLLSLAAPTIVHSEEHFLVGPRAEDLAAIDEAFAEAMDHVLGCGGDTDAGRLLEVDAALRPIWDVVPKNRQGRVEWRLLRYVVHRYFVKQSGIVVRGFEPTRLLNSSGMLSKLGNRATVEASFHAKSSSAGFSFADALSTVVAVEQFMRKREVKLLEQTYRRAGNSSTSTLNNADFASIIESYLVHWMIDAELNMGEVNSLLKDRSSIQEVWPRWTDFSRFSSGLVEGLQFSRDRSSLAGHGRVAMTHQYSFEDAREVASSITRGFANFWETECQVIKAALVELDRDGTGRVSLSEFYGSNVDGEWRFAESEDYLRDLGALDESSSRGSRGAQVIIPNYMQGASNCIVTSQHYLVCCASECEAVLNEIEETIGSPVGTPQEILEIVRNITDFNDEAPKMSSALSSQLHTIAAHHGGRVPLHGRLFAQWLHFAFPRDCPFPHKVGAASWKTPSEFGDLMMASDEALQVHAALRTNGSLLSKEPAADLDGAPWMTQWSADEELLSDYSRHLRNPWSDACKVFTVAGGLAAVLAVAWASVVRGQKDASNDLYGPDRRLHFL